MYVVLSGEEGENGMHDPERIQTLEAHPITQFAVIWQSVFSNRIPQTAVVPGGCALLLDPRNLTHTHSNKTIKIAENRQLLGPISKHFFF